MISDVVTDRPQNPAPVDYLASRKSNSIYYNVFDREPKEVFCVRIFHRWQNGQALVMRHDWTLLCSRVAYPPDRSIDLINIVSAVKVADRYRSASIDTTIPVDAPIFLVSQWSVEFENEKRVHSGVLQLMAPGGERVLQQYKLELDCRDTIVSRFISRIPRIRFVGLGTYEFHFVLDGFAELGEWGRACLRIN